MGLDIHLYTGLEKIESNVLEGDSIITLYPSEIFSRGEDGLVGTYRFKDSDHFHAGNYSSYNYWRNKLCELTNSMSDKEFWDLDVHELPFYKLINFSDCDGFIGPLTALELVEDFQDFQARVDAMDKDCYEGSGYGFKEQYFSFMNFFERAGREDGVVVFS